MGTFAFFHKTQGSLGLFQPTRKEVHRRTADEASYEAVNGLMVEVLRRADLLNPAFRHHDDPVRHGHGLGLVMGDEDHGSSQSAV